MGRRIEVSAKTIDDAIEKGLLQLGLERESVTVEVLENPKSGFLGIGGSNAKILMTELGEDGEPLPVDETEKISEKPAKETRAEKKKAKEAPSSGDMKGAHEFLQNVVSFICEDAQIKEIERADGTLKLEVVGERLGGIIGRRGETLDALQHLANLVENRGSGEKMRVSLDAENYRAKRADSLEKFARRAANQVIKYKRSKTLEPMNAYERHVVHVALQDMENISTASVGADPNRRVVISYAGPDAPRRYNNRPPRNNA